MTVDRAQLRRMYNLPTSQARVSVYHAVPDLLDELDSQDRRIAELEQAVESGNEAFRTVRIEWRRQLDGLKSALREALEHWRCPPQTAAEKTRKDEIWALAHGRTDLLASEGK